MDERLRIAVVGCMVLSACGSDVPTPNDVGQMFAEAFCAAKSRCCQAQGAPLTATEMSSCMSLVGNVPSRSSPLPPGQAQFNAGVAQRCVQAAARYDCTNGSLIMDLCAFVFTGHSALGQSCTQYNGCEQPSGGNAVCENGICVAATLFQGVGAACPNGELEECDLMSGLWCNAGVCAAPLKVGDGCNVIAACPVGTDCTAIAPQVCAPQLPIGAACDNLGYFPCQPPGECTNGVCTMASQCVSHDP